MDNRGVFFEQHLGEPLDPLFRELNFRRPPAVSTVMLSYQSVPRNNVELREKHHVAMSKVLWNAVDTFDEKMGIIRSQEGSNLFEQTRIVDTFKNVLSSAQTVRFPREELESMTFDFIGTSLNPNEDISYRKRRAAGDIGMALGGESLEVMKFRYVAEQYTDLLRASHKLRRQDPRFTSTLTTAEKLLDRMDVIATTSESPSLLNEMSRYTRKHAKVAATAGTAAVIAVSILTPSVAVAAESKPTTPTSHVGEATPIVKAEEKVSQVTVGMAIPTQAASLATTITKPVSTVAKVPTVGVEMATSTSAETVSASSNANTATSIPAAALNPETHTTVLSVEVGMSATSAGSSQSETTPIPSLSTSEATQTATPKVPTVEVGLAVPGTLQPPTPGSTTTDGETNSLTTGTTSGETSNDGSSTNALSQISASNPANIPTSISQNTVVSTVESTTSQEQSPGTTLTPEQIAVQNIQNTIENDPADESVPIASSLLQAAFGTVNSSGTTNSALLSSVQSLETTVEGTITSGGHPNNSTYNNQSLMALAVLDAAANDKGILQDQVLALVNDIQRPTDEYEGKLYDQYLAKAKAILSAAPAATTPETTAPTTDVTTANPDAASMVNPLEASTDAATNTDQETNTDSSQINTGANASTTTETSPSVAAPTSLLEGYTPAQQDQLTTLYTFALMAADPDSKQTSEIEDIKAAEAAAKAKAEALAKSIAETKNQSEHKASAQSEAIQNLINSAGNTVSKNAYTILQFYMNKGLTADEAAGLLGNFMTESASTLNPAINQYGGGPGHGIGQWETNAKGTGRWDDFVNYAQANNLDIYSLSAQLRWSWQELTGGYGNVLNDILAARTEQQSTTVVMDYYETPWVVLYGSAAAQQAEANTRSSEGMPFLAALNNETASIQHQRAVAAAQAVAHAAAVKKAQEEAATAKAAEQQQSDSQKILVAAEAQLAQWNNGTFRPLADMEPGKTDYLAYTGQTHTNWCADFVSTVIQNAGLDLPDSQGSNAVVINVKNNLLSTGQYTWHAAGSYTPGAGDIAFYGDYGHINIVSSATGPYSYMSIGGNEGNYSAPAYAAAYGGKAAYNASGAAYDNSYVEQEGGTNFGGQVVGFLSHN